MSEKWPKVSEVYTSKCPDCGKPGDVSRILDEHGLRDNRDSYLVVHETGEDGYPDLFWNEIVSSCGPFSWAQISRREEAATVASEDKVAALEEVAAAARAFLAGPSNCFTAESSIERRDLRRHLEDAITNLGKEESK